MTVSLEYGVPTDKCGLQLRLGIERGLFRDEGVDVSLKVVFGGPEIAAEYDSGRLKIGELGTPPCLTARGRGGRFKIVGSSVRRGAVQYFVARPELKDWADLRGRRLAALTRGSCSYWYMRELLMHNEIDPDQDVEVIGLGPRYPEVVELIAAGEIDGAVISEPNVSIGEELDAFRVWLSLSSLDFVPRMQWSVCVANEDAITKEADAIASVLRGCRHSYRYAADNPDEWAAFGALYFGISQETMRRSINREIGSLHFDCEIDVEGLENAIDLQQKLGAVQRPMKIEDVADFRFLGARLGGDRTSIRKPFC